MSNRALLTLYEEHVGKVSDKWSLYFAEYDRILDAYRRNPVCLLEIGIQNGGSLEIWSKYFPQVQKLVGCDINPDCAGLRYEDPRIAVVVGDANADATEAQILRHAPVFDVIIDDGSHRSSDTVRSFARYFPHLADDGVYIAEDLHCSYWEAFEGGLFDPFSSMTFFKRLADVISQEHWGIEKNRADILRGVFAKYDCQIDEPTLGHVHAVEFINSMCVIRKAKPERNRLGKRVIVGSGGTVVPGDVLRSSLERAPDETANQRSARNGPPEEEILLRMMELAERDEQIVILSEALTDRDAHIARLKRVVSERDAQIASLENGMLAYETSLSWRVMAPLRIMRYQMGCIKSFVTVAVMLVVHPMELKRTVQKAMRIYRREGSGGVGDRLRMLEADQYARKMAMQRGFSSEFLDAVIGCGKILSRLRKWWRAGAMRRWSSERVAVFLRGEGKAREHLLKGLSAFILMNHTLG